jgi:hypothetical protein
MKSLKKIYEAWLLINSMLNDEIKKNLNWKNDRKKT